MDNFTVGNEGRYKYEGKEPKELIKILLKQLESSLNKLRFEDHMVYSNNQSKKYTHDQKRYFFLLRQYKGELDSIDWIVRCIDEYYLKEELNKRKK